MKRLLTHALLLSALLLMMGLNGLTQTIKIWPDQSVGNGVTYGGDVKLTMWRIMDNGTMNSINNKMKNDLQMDLIRLPMVAMWGTGDSRHLDVRDYAIDVQSKGMDVFLSVANTDGTFKANGDLGDAHNVHKFASWQLCNGCSNPGLYNINLDQYKSWLQTLVNNKIGSGNVDYLGPWNEDGADLNDYTSLDFGEDIVGVEAWGLSNADTKYASVGSAIDVAGAHNYASNNAQPNLLNSYAEWADFAAAGNKPEWFTEPTLYAKSTSEGIAHMLPAISSGIEKMVLYQTVPRIIYANGSNAPHFDATKRLIDYSKGLGAARKVETNNRYGVVASFVDGTDLEIHLCNVDGSSRTMYINLQDGYTISGLSSQAYGGTVSTSTNNGGAQIIVTIPAKTYVHITASGLDANLPPYEYINHNSSGRRLWGDPGTDLVSTGTGSGNWVQWQEYDAGGGYFYLVHKASGNKLHSYNGTDVNLTSPGSTGDNVKWSWLSAGSGWYRLVHKGSGNWLHCNSDGTSTFRLGPTSWTGDNTKWQTSSASRLENPQPEIRIYPNPAEGGRVIVDLSALPPLESTVTMRLFDLQGRLLDQRDLSEQSIIKLDYSTQPSGLYILEVNAGEQVERHRLALE